MVQVVGEIVLICLVRVCIISSLDPKIKIENVVDIIFNSLEIEQHLLLGYQTPAEKVVSKYTRRNKRISGNIISITTSLPFIVFEFSTFGHSVKSVMVDLVQGAFYSDVGGKLEVKSDKYGRDMF